MVALGEASSLVAPARGELPRAQGPRHPGRSRGGSATELGGRVPDTMEGLTAFRGVGPKIAALTLAVGFGRPAIAVDIHVHRVTNRWGYVATRTPEQTMAALAPCCPSGTGSRSTSGWSPSASGSAPAPRRRKCSTCLLLSMCRQVGVVKQR